MLNELDQMIDNEATRSKFLGRLHGLCVNRRIVKCIVLTKPLGQSFFKPARHFFIQPRHIHQDLIYMVNRSLSSHSPFYDRIEEKRRQIVHRVIDGAQESFVLMDLTTELLLREAIHEGFTRASNNLFKSAFDATQRLIFQLDMTAADAKLILFCLLVIERPLTLRETQSLLEIETATFEHKSTRIDVEERIRQTCGSLLQVQDGIVRFRHVAIRQYLEDLVKAGKYLLKREDAHRELTYRCLAYINNLVTSKTICSVVVSGSDEVEALLQTYHLLEYATRYWIKHFRSSSMYRQNGQHEITAEFRDYFSRSVLQARIEWGCWNIQFSITETLEMHRLALNLRKSILIESHAIVLQTLITIARTYEKTNNATEACTFYYEAFKLSRTVCGAYDEVIMTCVESFLTCITSVVTTTRTETITRKEEMLQMVIATHAHYFGHSSEEVIRYKKMLAQLYIEIQETILAIGIYREVYETCIELYDEFHSKTTTVDESLVVILQRESRYEEMLLYLRLSFTRAEDNMDVTNIRRIRITVRSSVMTGKVFLTDSCSSCD